MRLNKQTEPKKDAPITPKELIQVLSTRVIAYRPIYTLMSGSTTAGILLSQLMYWAKEMDWGSFYKTPAEILEETGLTRHEYLLARNKLESAQFISTQITGRPRRMFWSVSIDVIGPCAVDIIRKADLVTRSGKRIDKIRKADRQDPESGLSTISKDYTKELRELPTKKSNLAPHISPRTAQWLAEYERTGIIPEAAKNNASFGRIVGRKQK